MNEISLDHAGPNGPAHARAREHIADRRPGLPATTAVAAWVLVLDELTSVERVRHVLAHGPQEVLLPALLLRSRLEPGRLLPWVAGLKVLLESGVPLPAIEWKLPEDAAVLLALGARPDLASQADDLVLHWYADNRPELWPPLALPWVRDVEVLEVAMARWLDVASGVEEAAFLLGFWVNRAGGAIDLLRKIFPMLKPRARESAARWLAAEAPERAGALLGGFAIGEPSRLRAIALSFARRWPELMLPHLPEQTGTKSKSRLAGLREHLASRPQAEADLRKRLGEAGAEAVLPFLRAVPDWAMLGRVPACKDRTGAPCPVAIPLALLGSLACDPGNEGAAHLAATLAPTDLAALLDAAVKMALRDREAAPYLALGALAHLPEAVAVELFVSWMPEMPWTAEASIVAMDRVPRAVIARAILACGARPNGAEIARAAARHLAGASGKRPLQVWAAWVPEELGDRFLKASLREVILESASAPEMPSLIGSVFANRPAWRAWALDVLNDRLHANSVRRKARDVAKDEAMASARAFLRTRPATSPLVGLDVDAQVLHAHHWQQRFTEGDWKYSYELTRRRGATTFEVSHFPALAEMDAHGPPLVVRIRSWHPPIDPHSEDHLLIVHEVVEALAPPAQHDP